MAKLEIPKEYLRIAARFMKELGLYVYWMRYINDGSRVKNWYDKGKNYNILDVFGATQFTRFLEENGKYMPDGYCVYEIFARYVNEFYEGYKGTFPSENVCPPEYLDIDIDKKKITLTNFYE